MTEEQISQLVRETAREAAREAVRETLHTLGVDAGNPLGMQADLAYLRRQREVSERIGLRLRLALITVIVTGALAMLWLGVTVAIKGEI
ncbi:MAG: hypothetical protein HQ501_01375 [Rhodospirillales bacterium]|jgi:hypothetical protein|nr:hypothetical protein [Rhodospirillales bacterium]